MVLEPTCRMAMQKRRHQRRATSKARVVMPTLAMPIIEVLLVRWMAFPGMPTPFSAPTFVSIAERRPDAESGLQNHWILNGIYLLESVPGFILEYQY